MPLALPSEYRAGRAEAPRAAISLPYEYSSRVYQGEVIPPGRASAPGGLLVPYGSTIEGQAQRPGYASYGPYGGGPGGPGGPGGHGPYGGPEGYRYTPGRVPHFAGGMEAGIATYFGTQALRDIGRATAEPKEIEAGLLSQGFSPEQVKEARKRAEETQRKVFGSSIVGNLRVTSAAMAVLQSPEEAIKITPELSRFGVALGALGEGGQFGELMDALRSAEYRGVFTKVDASGKRTFDQSKLRPFLENMLIATSMTHGSIGPHQILQYLRSSGGAGAITSDQFLFADSLANIIAMGAARAGTGLQGMEQQFSAGKMSEAAVSMLQDMNVLVPGNPKHSKFFNKLGIGQFQLQPGAYRDPHIYELMREHPTSFMHDFLEPKVREYVERNFKSQLDEPGLSPQRRRELVDEDVQAAMIALASRIPGGKLMSETSRNFALIDRDRKQRLRMMGYDPDTHQKVGPGVDVFKIQTEKNPAVQMQAFDAAWHSFLISLGDPVFNQAVAALNGFTGGLNGVSKWSEQHSELTRAAIEAFGGALVGLATAGGVAVLMTLGGATGVLAAVGASAIVAAEGAKALDKELRTLFPEVYKGADKTREGIRKGGVEVPWWFPLPTPSGGRAPAPDWLKRILPSAPHGPFFDMPHYPGVAPRTSAATPMAPNKASIVYAGTRDNPLSVVIANKPTVNVGNGRDLLRGTASGVADLLNRPDSGTWGPDPSSSFTGAKYGR